MTAQLERLVMFESVHMALNQRQKSERERVANLAKSIERNATTVDDLVKILRSYSGFHNDNPVDHIKNALADYVAERAET